MFRQQTRMTPHMSPITEDSKAKSAAKDKPKPDKKATNKAQAQKDLQPDAKPTSKDDLKSIPMADLQAKLQSSPEGLTQNEAQKRLTQYGPNELAVKKTNALLKFLGYFWGPIPWMIEAAAILSGVVRHWLDFFIILFLLGSNAVVGFWEEHQAGNAIAALKAKLATDARAKRDDKWTTPKAKELVPGDVIRLRLGDIVPAKRQKSYARNLDHSFELRKVAEAGTSPCGAFQQPAMCNRRYGVRLPTCRIPRSRALLCCPQIGPGCQEGVEKFANSTFQAPCPLTLTRI